MGFLNIFKKNNTEQIKPRLFYSLKNLLIDQDDDKIHYLTCLCGVIARVIHIDLKIETSELAHFKKMINLFFPTLVNYTNQIVELSMNEIEDLIDLENHLFSTPLRDILNESQRYELIKMLFEISASDGSVDNIESEEIRMIAKNLQMTDQHFLAARALVKNNISALKK